MIHNMRKRTFWHVRPMTTQTSLHICAVWSVYVVHMKKLSILAVQNAAIEDSDQTVLIGRLIWFCWAHVSEGTISDILAQIAQMGIQDDFWGGLIWSNYLTYSIYLGGQGPEQTVKTQIRCHRMQHLIRVYTVWHSSIGWKMDLLKRSIR